MRWRFRTHLFLGKPVSKTNLMQGLYLQNYQTQAANKINLKEFSYRRESLKYSYLSFCVRE